MKEIRIATRKSKLALWQANYVKSLISKYNPECDVQIVKIVTKGDKILDKSLSKIGGKGLFVREIEEALLSGAADVAVHSMKDVGYNMVNSLQITAYLKPDSPYDAFISNSTVTQIEDLPQKACVGTSSLRRKVQLIRLRPDLTIKDLRGNVDTRLQKLQDGQYDAIILAEAGLNRLCLQHNISSVLKIHNGFVPAINQGIVGIQTRVEDSSLNQIIQSFNHEESRIRALIERGFLTTLEGTCSTPLGCYAQIIGKNITFYAFVSSEDASNFLPLNSKFNTDEIKANPFKKGVELGNLLLNMGGREILDSIQS